MNKISRSIVARLLTKPCPALIPRTGPTAKEINCYALSLFEAENPRLLISGITETGFEGKFWNGSEFNAQATVPFRYFPGLTLRIDHYHGLVHHTYYGILNYVLSEWSQIYRIKSVWVLAKKAVPQFFFNKRKLELPTRMHLLEKIIAKQASEPGKTFSSLDLMTYIYSIRWYLHPNKDDMKRKLELYLESFVASGELEKLGGGGEYMATGGAISTLENYQIETSRAKDAKSFQYWMLWLTVILAFFSAFQSGLFSSPVWVDFGKLWEYVKSYI